MSANGYKIKVNGEAESREAQELFFELGYIWNTGLGPKHLDSKFLYAKKGILTMGFDSDDFDDSANKEITLEELRNLVNGNENGLISGKDALIALANGEEVEIKFNDKHGWHNINKKDAYSFETFLDPIRTEFRLKPRTITINGIEVPAPFEPKIDDVYYFINSSNLRGYGHNKFNNDGDDECLTFYGAWRTESEIKQVVAALRSVFTCN
jgi:hypothetical protein